MKSKILTKTVKQKTLFSVIIAVILAAAIGIGIWFGVSAKYSIFNTSVTMESQKTLTITVDQFGYNNNLEELETECEKLFGNLNYAYEMKGQMTGDESELVYVFESNADLTNAKAAVEAYFKAATVQKDGVFEGMYITVSTNSEVIKANIAQDYLLRAAIAGAVMLVLAFVYVSLRYRVSVGALTVISGILGGALTTAIVILARIPVSVSVSYAIVVAALLAMVATLLTMSKARLNQASESEMEKSAEDQVVSAIAGKEICAMTVLGGVAIIFMGALATTAVRWFAIVALIGLLVSAFIGLFCVPAWYLPMKKAADKKAASKSEYQGAKKTSKKVKKAFVAAKKAAPVEEAPVEAAPAEETVEETPVEEAEEVNEEVEATEEVEEAPAEEAAEEVAEAVEEAPVEEVAEEAVEENKED